MEYSLKKLIFSTRCNSKVPLNDKREGVMQQDSIKVNLSDLEVRILAVRSKGNFPNWANFCFQLLKNSIFTSGNLKR
jgi:hypothetical protein